ncbi:hypothetical protein Vspart_00503 [Vibrio spartinae]|uniref:Uncharacterized protein n=1 Tax=Vibrio spartinae TaxID=1918945 RepID=A0A1N6M3Y6_9VIBR|nr:hypothetical protein Vspart_00503 [Vibrio spartinae]SIO94159.1 hypothetical protein VSP9026_01846 [Vibrio spartinae]
MLSFSDKWFANRQKGMLDRISFVADWTVTHLVAG